MKLRMRDRRTFEGDALDIVRQWKESSFDAPNLTLEEYVRGVVARAWEWDGTKLDVSGDTEEELAKSLLDEVVRTGLAVRLDHVLH